MPGVNPGSAPVEQAPLTEHPQTVGGRLDRSLPTPAWRLVSVGQRPARRLSTTPCLSPHGPKPRPSAVPWFPCGNRLQGCVAAPSCPGRTSEIPRASAVPVRPFTRSPHTGLRSRLSAQSHKHLRSWSLNVSRSSRPPLCSRSPRLTFRCPGPLPVTALSAVTDLSQEDRPVHRSAEGAAMLVWWVPGLLPTERFLRPTLPVRSAHRRRTQGHLLLPSRSAVSAGRTLKTVPGLSTGLGQMLAFSAIISARHNSGGLRRFGCGGWI